MEKENSKCREDARKQYNTTVQRLVAHCRRFDPRYKEAVESEARAAAKLEAERNRRREEEKAKRLAKLQENMESQVTMVRIVYAPSSRLKSRKRHIPWMIPCTKRQGRTISMNV